MTRLVAEGADARNQAAKRDRLRGRVDDLRPAIELARSREEAARKAAAEAERAEALKSAEEAAFALMDAAKAVDGKLAELEATFADYLLARVAIERAMAAAGVPDMSQLRRRTGPALRWATWEAAPEYASESQLPRADMTRRRSFFNSVATSMPRIG